MSRTKLHTEIGKFKNGLIEYKDLEYSTKLHFRRYNRDDGDFRNEKNSKLLKELIKEHGV